MDSIWEKLYDSAKDRRYGILFMATWSGIFGLSLLSIFISELSSENGAQEFFLATLSGAVISMLGISWWVIRRRRRRPEERIEYRELSRDELAKARSKLMNGKLKS